MIEINQQRRRRRRDDEYCSTTATTATVTAGRSERSSSSSYKRSCTGVYHIGLLVMCCWWFVSFVLFEPVESFCFQHHVVSNNVDRISSSSQYLSTVKDDGPNNPCYYRSSSSLSVATSSASTTGEDINIRTTPTSRRLTREELQTLTVKELKQVVKDSPYNERGILTKLKLKQDLINFLVEKYSNNNNSNENDEDEGRRLLPPTAPTKTEQKRNSRIPPMGMPSSTKVKIANSKKSAKTSMLLQQQQQQQEEEELELELVEVGDNDDSESSSPTTPKPKATTTASLKDTLFDRVYERYPPILTNPENCTGLGDFDIRQSYHPMLKQFSNTSSDMDIVFVGTASCTPGVSRGVSCTALRLNWKRRSFQFFAPDNMSPISSTSSSSSSSSSASRNNNGQQQHQQQQQHDQMIDLATSFSGGTWLFDCGECTQLQVQRTSSIKPSKITKIFITHAHGDHSFGLPGLLCLMGQDRDRTTGAQPVDIYGPEGLRMWLRVAIRYSVSRIVPPYRVHEIKDIPMAPEWDFSRRSNRFYYNVNKNSKGGQRWGTQGLPGEDPQSWISRANFMNLEPNYQYGEIDGGRDIFPTYDHPNSFDGAPVWDVEDEDDVRVYAAPMSHGIPCVGYVVEERTQPGRLRHEYVKPIVERNLDALKKQGFSIPMKAMAVIKNLPPGSAFTFPDGTVVTQEDAVEAPRKGRKVVICGDSCSSRAISGLAQNADILVHEATNSFLTGVDKDTNVRTVTRDAVVHGHSTPHMAGDFARKIGAKRLVLNHFSARYKGDQSVDSMSIMMRIEEQALKTSGLDETNVAAAWDMMVLPIPRNN